MIRNAFTVLALCSTLAALSSCATPQTCNITAEGNLGSRVNSPYDEYFPVVYNTTRLYFTSNRPGGTRQFKIDSVSAYGEDLWFSDLYSGVAAMAEFATDMPVNSFDNDGALSYRYDAERGFTELYFTTFTGEGVNANADIVVAEFAGGVWGEPRLLAGLVNTDAWEGHPAISPDGSFLVFASDREGGFGGIDLYISWRREDGSWSLPANLGEQVNSRFDDITPSLDAQGALYYATQAMSTDRTFDVVVAQSLGAGEFDAPDLLPFPINTQFDEISPRPWGDSLLLASKRVGSCGGYDLYAFLRCHSVTLQGVVEGGMRFPGRETITAVPQDGSPALTVDVSETGAFSASLRPRLTYDLFYSGPCSEVLDPVATVSAPCAPEPSQIRVSVAVPAALADQNPRPVTRDIPWFVSGYYRPTTVESLRELQLLRTYNLRGVDDSTRYFADPPPDYLQKAEEVEEVFAEIVDEVSEWLSQPVGECSGRSMPKVAVEIVGYTDPRPFSARARYADIPINDPANGLVVRPGDPMTNELLSTLRAWHTQNILLTRLGRAGLSTDQMSNISVVIRGAGVYTGSPDQPEQRRIEVKVRRWMQR